MTRKSTQQTERRSQEERSKAMRKRLIKATVECLAVDGYAATTLSKIVVRAGVSRGAQVHHYASKNELILDSALYLMRRSYRLFGEVLLDIAEEDNRLKALIHAAWDVIYSQPSANAFMELLIACQHEKSLANIAKELNREITEAVRGPIDHYFEKRNENSESPVDMFRGLLTYMCGMSCSQVLMDEEAINLQIDMWYRLMRDHVVARKGVTTPPPSPIPVNLKLT